MMERPRPHHCSDHEVCRLVCGRGRNDCIVLDGQGDGAPLKHPDGDGVEATSQPTPVRQLHCSWRDQLHLDPKEVKVVGPEPQLVALQGSAATVSGLLGQRIQQQWRLQHQTSSRHLPRNKALHGIRWKCALLQFVLAVKCYSKGVLIPYF